MENGQFNDKITMYKNECRKANTIRISKTLGILFDEMYQDLSVMLVSRVTIHVFRCKYSLSRSLNVVKYRRNNKCNSVPAMESDRDIGCLRIQLKQVALFNDQKHVSIGQLAIRGQRLREMTRWASTWTYCELGMSK